MYFDPASVYESDIEPWLGDHLLGENRTIEEWSVREPASHLPDAASIVLWLVESAAEDEMDEHGGEAFYEARNMPDVLAAAEKLRETLAAHVRYRMADKHLCDHVITFDEDGDPLYDGEPLYVPNEDVRRGVLRAMGAAL